LADVQIGVATASTPTGPFKDALGKPLIKTAEFGGQSIDPYAFIDDDGRAYLYFGEHLRLYFNADGSIVPVVPTQ
jgi:beta-xylosidase